MKFFSKDKIKILMIRIINMVIFLKIVLYFLVMNLRKEICTLEFDMFFVTMCYNEIFLKL